MISGFYWKELAATYSRRTYRTTTIGKAMFDGRVRNGNGSDHSFMATKLIVADVDRNFLKDRAGNRQFSENYTQESLD